jgi:sarcosine oxidase subunit alpha
VNAPHGYYDKAYLCRGRGDRRGPAGRAALTARRQRPVLIIDDQPVLGGSLNYLRCDAAVSARQESATRSSEVATTPQTTVMTGASCEGLFADGGLR